MNARYIECSAKENQGIQDVFELAINTAIAVEEESYEVKKSETGKAVRGKKVKKRKCVFL
jgi:Ras homolog gene family, member A